MRNLGPHQHQKREIQDRLGPEPTRIRKSWTGPGKIWKSRTDSDQVKMEKFTWKMEKAAEAAKRNVIKSYFVIGILEQFEDTLTFEIAILYTDWEAHAKILQWNQNRRLVKSERFCALQGYIDTGDGCWRRNELATTSRCSWRLYPFWSPTSTIFLHYRWAPTMLVQHSKDVTNIKIRSPTSKFDRQHPQIVTNFKSLRRGKIWMASKIYLV